MARSRHGAEAACDRLRAHATGSARIRVPRSPSTRRTTGPAGAGHCAASRARSSPRRRTVYSKDQTPPAAALAGEAFRDGRSGRGRGRAGSAVGDEAPRAVGLPRPQGEVLAVEAIHGPVVIRDRVDGSPNRVAEI